MKDAYEQAGVNIVAGEKVVSALQQKMKLQDSHVLDQIGGFAGCYEVDRDQQTRPILVAGSDGVGTKVLLAAQANQVNTIGQDLVAMCVNDLLAQGATPLFFLDYLALAHLDEYQVEQILSGVLAACTDNQIALLGGETAEMPGVYQPQHFDLAGFAVGLVAKQNLLNPHNIQAGDYLIGLPSSGLHSNGFSLVRKILFQDKNYQFTDVIPTIGQSLIDELLRPTKIYSSIMQPLFGERLIAGAAHITGGGVLKNVPRMLSADLLAKIDVTTWPLQPIFESLVHEAQLTIQESYQTFNMGLGMVLAVHPANFGKLAALLDAQHELYYRIGQVESKEDLKEAQVKLVGVIDD